MTEWLDVDYDLPTMKGYYLVYIPNSLPQYTEESKMEVIFWRGKTTWARRNDKITHWMFLPVSPDTSWMEE